MLLEERPDVGVGLLLLTKSVRAVFFFFFKHFFFWLGWVTVAARGSSVFLVTCEIFRCAMWDLVP